MNFNRTSWAANFLVVFTLLLLFLRFYLPIPLAVADAGTYRSLTCMHLFADTWYRSGLAIEIAQIESQPLSKLEKLQATYLALKVEEYRFADSPFMTGRREEVLDGTTIEALKLRFSSEFHVLNQSDRKITDFYVNRIHLKYIQTATALYNELIRVYAAHIRGQALAELREILHAKIGNTSLYQRYLTPDQAAHYFENQPWLQIIHSFLIQQTGLTGTRNVLSSPRGLVSWQDLQALRNHERCCNSGGCDHCPHNIGLEKNNFHPDRKTNSY